MLLLIAAQAVQLPDIELHATIAARSAVTDSAGRIVASRLTGRWS